MKEVLSVIVPVYNSEQYISRCIDSILKQTYTRFEVLIVDDGSTDGSYQLCSRFADCDNRIRLVHQEHKGVAYTRKSAISMAVGEYMIFVDSDDWIEPDYLQMAVDNMNSMDAVIMGYYADDEKCLNMPSVAEGIYSGQELEVIWRSLFSASFSDGVSGVLWDKVLKTSLVKHAAVNIPDELYLSEDRCIEMQVLLSAQNISVLNMGGYHYCSNKDSITHSVHKDYLYNEHLYYQTMQKVIKTHPFREELEKSLDRNIVARLPMTINMLGIASDNFWYYPYYGRLVSARVILYGAGKVGKSYYNSILRDKESIIVAWVDKEYTAYKKEGLDVTSPDIVTGLEYDYVIIAVYDEGKANEIKRSLMHMGVLEEDILWNKTRYGIV